MQVGAKMATDKANMSAQQQEAGLRMGIEVARSQMESMRRPSVTQNNTSQGQTEE
jgi:hypothetical protein